MRSHPRRLIENNTIRATSAPIQDIKFMSKEKLFVKCTIMKIHFRNIQYCRLAALPGTFNFARKNEASFLCKGVADSGSLNFCTTINRLPNRPNMHLTDSTFKLSKVRKISLCKVANSDSVHMLSKRNQVTNNLQDLHLRPQFHRLYSRYDLEVVWEPPWLAKNLCNRFKPNSFPQHHKMSPQISSLTMHPRDS